MAGIQYPRSLANHIAGSEVFSGEHISSQFNSDIDFSFSTTAQPGPGQESLFSTAAHEFLHGLGFFGGIAEDGSYDLGTPTIFDKFTLANGVDINTLSQGDRSNAMTGGQLTLSGIASNLLAPSPFEPGSSGSHWDRGSGAFLMLPEAPAVGPEPLFVTATDLATMQLIGWGGSVGNPTVPEPTSLAVWSIFAFVCGGTCVRRKRCE